MEHITRETVLDADPADVWEAVTEQLGDWFGAEVSGELGPGEPLRFRSPDGTERRAVVERVDPPRELVFRWLDDPSRVAITIEDTPDGSIVRVVERRIEAAVSPVPSIGFRMERSDSPKRMERSDSLKKSLARA